MPFCPRCGKEVLAEDQFCLNCGQRLERLHSQTEIQTSQAPPLVPPVPAMDTSSLYLIGEQGLLKVGTWFPLVAVTIALAVLLGIIVASVSGFNAVASIVVASLIIAPIIGEARARRLASLTKLSYEELASKKGVRSISWSSIEFMRAGGRKLAFKANNSWVSSRIDPGDAGRLADRAASMLGGRFARTPERPSRFSPLTKFLLLTAVVLAVSELILAAATLTPFFAGEQESYTTTYNSIQAQVAATPTVFQLWWEIFANNIQIALFGFVPALGTLALALASYNTGRILQVIGVLNHAPPPFVLFAIFILPHSWAEELSYPLAAALGYYSLTWRHQSYAEFSNWKTRASTKVTLGFLVVALVLAIAAVLEVSEPDLGGVGALLLWLPVIAICLYAYVKLKPRLDRALS